MFSCSWDFFSSCCPYFDKDTNLLSFPVWVSVSDVGAPASPPLEVTVMALVAPPCPLTISPSCLPLGQVSTQETVCADIVLVNHNVNCSYTYCFHNLPEVRLNEFQIPVEPAGNTKYTLSSNYVFRSYLQDVSFKPGTLFSGLHPTCIKDESCRNCMRFL